MKKLFSVFIPLVFLFVTSSCSIDLGFKPTRLYKFSASLKYTVDNNVSQEKPEIQLFTNYESMCFYFNEYTNPYGGGDIAILEKIDFEKSNLFGYMMEEGTGSTLHAVSVENTNITVYSYTPEVVTNDLAYKWLIFEVDKMYELSDFVIKTQKMSVKQKNYLVDNFEERYWF